MWLWKNEQKWTEMVNLVCGILSLTCGQDGNEATGLWSGWERNAAKNIRVPKVSIIPHFCGLRSRRFRNVYFGRVKNDAREREGRGKEGFLFYSTPPLFIFRMSKTHTMERPAPAQATTWVIIPRDVTTAILVKWRLLFRIQISCKYFPLFCWQIVMTTHQDGEASGE